jgi:hypothetical protein
MSYLKIDTGINEVLLKKCYDVEDCVTYYDVYDMPYCEEELTGMYLGEFASKYELEDSDEREFFLQDLDEWLKYNN